MTASKKQPKAARRAKGEGSIFEREGRWIGRLSYVDPLTGLLRRTQVSAATKQQVAGKLRAVRRRVDAGSPARDNKAELASYAAVWMQTTLAASDRKISTRSLYEGLTRTHIVGSDLGRLPLNKVQPSSVERWILQLRRKGLSESTVRQAYTVGRAIGDAAVRDAHLARNPFAAIKRPKVTAKEAACLTPVQVEALLAAAESSRYRLLFELLVTTGLRRGEALALRWSDVDLTNDVLHVRGTLARVDGELIVTETKSENSKRTVPLSAPAVAVLRSAKSRQAAERLRAGNQWHTTGYVFTTEFGQPCDPRNALRALSVAAKAVGLSGAGLHTLRHSVASVMISGGVPLKVVSDILGHSGIAITANIYGHVSPEVSRSAVDALAQHLATSSRA